MINDSHNADRLADSHEVSKAVRIILRDAPGEEAQILSTLLAKMHQVAPGKKRRASDKPQGEMP